MKRESVESAIDAVGLTMGARRDCKTSYKDFAYYGCFMETVTFLIKGDYWTICPRAKT